MPWASCFARAKRKPQRLPIHHIAVNHRPRSSVLFFVRLTAEKFAGSGLARLFVVGKDRNRPTNVRRIDLLAAPSHSIGRVERCQMRLQLLAAPAVG